MSSVIERINSRMNPTISVKTEEYEAIWGKIPFTPLFSINESSDFRCGAIANELEFFLGFVDALSKADEIEDLTDPYLDIVIAFFSGLVRFIDEPDTTFINRFYAIVRRGNSIVWNTNYSIKQVYSYFFDPDNIFVIDHDKLLSESVVVNGDFSDDLDTEWDISDSGSRVTSRSEGDQFVSNAAIKFSGTGSSQLSQDCVVATSGGKILLFANLGPIDVQIISGGEYWNGVDWQVGAFTFEFSGSPDYQVNSVSFNLADPATVTIRFISDDSEDVYLDRVRLGDIGPGPEFTVLIISSGQAGEYLALIEPGEDPVVGVDYDLASYFEQSYIGGESSGLNNVALNQILGIVKAGGVKARIVVEAREV
jgi:hypothetical protein